VEEIVNNLIYKNDIVQIVYSHGAGATWFACALGLGITGQFELPKRLACKKQVNVLYNEGAMPSGRFNQRLKKLVSEPDMEKFRVNSFDDIFKKEGRQPSYLDQYMRDQMEENLGEVVIFDTMKSTFYPTDQNRSDSRNDVREWIARLRQKDVTQIYITPRGKSHFDLPEDFIDLKLKLSRLHSPMNFILRVEILRSRFLPAEFAEPFELEFIDGGVVEHKSIDRLKARVLSMAIMGQTQEQIAGKIEVRQSTISRWIKKFENASVIKKEGQSVTLTEQGRGWLKDNGVNPEVLCG
jgi:hypothetical protein